MIIEGIEIEKESPACIQVRAAGKVVYCDPYNIEKPEKADLILISHEDTGHFSLEDVEKVFKEETVIVTNIVCHPVLLQLENDINHLFVVGARERIDLGWCEVETVAAYNVNKLKNPKTAFHPQENEGLGFVLTIGGKRLYFAGDTDLIPEMGDVKNIDVAFLPVGGKTVMTAEEAARAAELIRPKVAVPVHWETRDKAEEFAHSVKDAVIL